jgi:hypothetical protein
MSNGPKLATTVAMAALLLVMLQQWLWCYSSQHCNNDGIAMMALRHCYSSQHYNNDGVATLQHYCNLQHCSSNGTATLLQRWRALSPKILLFFVYCFKLTTTTRRRVFTREIERTKKKRRGALKAVKDPDFIGWQECNNASSLW